MAEKKQAATIAMVVLLGIALAVILLVQFDVLSFSSSKGAAPGASAAGAPNVKPPATAGAAAQAAGPAWERPGPVRLGLRDPMQLDAAKLPPAPASVTPSSSEPAPPKPGFLVTGIVFNKEQSSSVIIDGQILYEGSTIHGATVVKITEQHAELSRGDKKWLVRPGQSNPEPE